MRILHVVPSYLPAWRYGGPIRSVHGLARAQAAAGHEVEVFTTDVDGPGRLEVPTDRPVAIDGVSVSYFRCGWPRRLCRAPAMAAALGRRVREFDAVHLHSVFLWPTRAAARAAAAAGVPYFVSPRGMLVDGLIRERGELRKRLWIRLVERQTLRRAAGIVLQSELERRELEALGLDLAPTHVVPNGIDAEEVERGLSERPSERAMAWMEGGPYVLYLGRLSWKKGLEPLVEAVATLGALRLLIAGNDEEGLRPALEQRARALGMSERLQFAGEVRGADKWSLLGNAALFCLPSRSENFGISALEALAVGTPVVVSPAVGLASDPVLAPHLELADDDPSSLADAIARVVSATESLDARSAAARRAVRESYGWDRIEREIRTVYSARGGRPGGATSSPGGIAPAG